MSIPNQPRPERGHISDLEETDTVSSLRPGDSMLIDDTGRWELVTHIGEAEGSDPSRLDVHTAAPHSGSAWLMDPAAEVRIRRGDPRHPIWCDPAYCAALDPLVSFHRGEPVVIPPPYTGDPTISVQLMKDSDEPIEQGRPSVVLIIDSTTLVGVPDVRGYDLDPLQVRGLVDALVPMLPHLGGAA